jgi:Cdc6-like AAA superfamily ATPase
MPINITTGKTPLPPRLFVYGVAGIGKTTLAATIPGAVVLPCEEGADAIDCARMDQPADFTAALAAIRSLWEDEHPYTTLVIDSVTALEQMIWQHVCAIGDEKGRPYKSIEDAGYGKGYVAAAEHWRKFLDGLTYLRKTNGMSIVLIGHCEVKAVNAPDSEPYDRYQPRLHKTPMAMLTEWSDALLFARYEQVIHEDEKTGKTRAVGSGTRCFRTTERPSHLAKNRYSMPDQIPFTYAAIESAITQAFA